MDIARNRLEGLVSVTSMLGRVAVIKNQENRKLINEPTQKSEAQKVSKVVDWSNNRAVSGKPDAKAVADSRAALGSVAVKLVDVPGVRSSTQPRTQTTGLLVNIKA